MNNYDPTQFDKSTFTMEPYVKRVEKPWGYELHFVREGLPYMGKIEHVNAGCQISLQVHSQKQETYILINGRAFLVYENEKGELVKIEFERGKSYTINIGQKHRFGGITDCDIVEFSMPEIGTTWRLEDDYKRPDETPEQRKLERGEN